MRTLPSFHRKCIISFSEKHPYTTGEASIFSFYSEATTLSRRARFCASGFPLAIFSLTYLPLDIYIFFPQVIPELLHGISKISEK
jgi:hypothetical protein